MSVCGQTEEDSASEEAAVPSRQIYQQKSVSKVIRVLTVLAYLLSVSLAAILLSVYYICVWKAPIKLAFNETEGEMSPQRADPYLPDNTIDDELILAGRSNTTVKEVVTQATLTNLSFANYSVTSPPALTTAQQLVDTVPSTTNPTPYSTTEAFDNTSVIDDQNLNATENT